MAILLSHNYFEIVHILLAEQNFDQNMTKQSANLGRPYHGRLGGRGT